MKIEIKTLTADDWEKYRNIRLECLKNDPTAFGSSYEESKDISEDIWRKRIDNVIFALAGDIPVGMIVVIFQTRIKTKHVAEIHGFYVSTKARGQGIGSQLMEAALKKIKMNSDIKKVKLEVNSAQDSAVRLYQKFGFETIGKRSKELLIEGSFYDNMLLDLFID